MEIERKFLIKELPDLSKYDYVDIEQGYLCTHPVVRIRKKNDKYIDKSLFKEIQKAGNRETVFFKECNSLPS